LADKLRKSDWPLRFERERSEAALKAAASRCAQKVESEEFAIRNILAIAKQMTPRTIEQMEIRIRSLNMVSAAESLAVAESSPNRSEDQIQSLRRQFSEANDRVSQRRSELDVLIHSIQSKKRQQHTEFRDSAIAVLMKIELAIDNRSGDFANRICVLRAQASPLSE
jgi:hypothetical protein